MKKFLCCLIAVAMLISGCMPVMANEGKVEISFCVGDDTLIINGTPVTVEKPYVVGAGVTLVPVRVITEAFDAKVDWIGETQTIKLTYPGVNIVIQIGNTTAEINGRAEKLLAAPELTKSGYTMVPLRFISENFGADVSYDDKTERITVTKEKTGDSTSSIKGSVDSKYIGDSYFNWSMENPMDMKMEQRNFDGMGTLFSDGKNEITVEIFTYDKEEYDFESDYTELKLSMSDLTLVKSEKNTEDKNCKKFHLAAKDKKLYYDYQQYVTPEYIYVVTGIFENEDAKLREQYLKLLSTFMCSFKQSDIYDLSNLKDGFRKFEAEHLKFSFNVPEKFYMESSEDAENRFEFYEIENGISSIIAAVYSKKDAESLKSFATEDFEHNKKVLNENLTTFHSGLVEKKYKNITATEYSYTVKAEKQNYHARDVYFEVGDYVYNVRVGIELPCDDYEAYIDKIINSIEAKPLNAEEIGMFMRNNPVATGTTKVKLGKATMSVPNIYMKMTSDESSIAYLGAVNGVLVSCIKVPASGATASDLRKMMRNAENGLKQEKAIVLKSVYEKTINNLKFQAFNVKSTTDEGTAYMEQLACLYNGNAYVFSIACSEIFYSESTQAEINNIINSIKFE